MIYGFLNQGSGVGNQLFRYITTRVKALDLGVDWRLIYMPDNSGKRSGFKCKDFIKFDNSKVINYFPDAKRFNEKKIVENGIDIRGYDPEFNFIEDNTIIEGEFQDERYWEHRLKDIRRWLKVEHVTMPDELCVISHRGGEYTIYPDLYLGMDYWNKAIELKRKENLNMIFQVQTDDLSAAKKQFPDFEIIYDKVHNWKAIRYAKHIILGNSSFGIIPALLNGTKNKIYAPRYWARHNKGIWALPQNYYKRFTYL